MTVSIFSKYIYPVNINIDHLMMYSTIMHEIRMIMYELISFSLFQLSQLSRIFEFLISNNVLNEMEYFVDQ